MYATYADRPGPSHGRIADGNVLIFRTAAITLHANRIINALIEIKCAYR